MRRTMLFMPGSKPGNLLNGDVYGADSIIIDLEDAVALAGSSPSTPCGPSTMTAS